MFNFVFGYPSWREYLQSMAKDGTWGDHVVLFAAANHFQTAIRIISSLDREIVVHPEQAVADPIPLVLGHIHELHYVSLQPRKGTVLVSFLSQSARFVLFDWWKMCCRYQPCTSVWCLCSREVRVGNCFCMDSLSTNYPNEFRNIVIAFVNAEKTISF